MVVFGRWDRMSVWAFVSGNSRADFAAVILTDASWNLDHECTGD